jgi:hypothetical protein
MKIKLMILTILILIVCIGYIWSQNKAQEKRINTLVGSIEEKNNRIIKLNLEIQGYELILKKRESSSPMCRQSKPAILELALKEGGRIENLKEIGEIYDMICADTPQK